MKSDMYPVQKQHDFQFIYPGPFAGVGRGKKEERETMYIDYWGKYYKMSKEIHVIFTLTSMVGNCAYLKDLVERDEHYAHNMYRIGNVKCISTTGWYNLEEISKYILYQPDGKTTELFDDLVQFDVILPASTYEISLTIVQGKPKNGFRYSHWIEEIKAIKPIPGEIKALPHGLRTVGILQGK